jgi:hypothetical protein
MKNKIFVLLVIYSLVILINGCKNYDEPGLINDPNKSYSQSPKISSVSPANSAIAGVREIVINGENFAVNGKDTNWVFIGGKPAPIKSVAANKIVVYRPNVSGTSLTIEVAIPMALGLSKITGYNIEKPIAQFGDFQYENYALMAIEVDNQENLYIATRRKVMKLTPDGINLTTLSTLGSTYAKITDMKLGKDGYLYLLIDKTTLNRINTATGADEIYVTLPNICSVLDFDADKNIYAAKQSGIYVVSSGKSVTSSGKYADVELVELRVYNNYVYVANSNHIWRNKILDTKGTLGDNETVVDLTTTSEFKLCEISHFNIGSDGTIILCLRSHPKYSIFVVESDKSITPFYKVDILPRSVDQLIWGSGRNLYLNRGLTLTRDSLRVFRMGMDKNGAPYLGR